LPSIKLLFFYMLSAFLRSSSLIRYAVGAGALLASVAFTACSGPDINLDELTAEALLRQKQVRKTDSLAITKYIADSSFTTARRQPSGLYIVTKAAGTGDQPRKGQQVSVVYKGTTLNNVVFDQSRVAPDGSRVPIVFALGSGQVIAGWELGIAELRKGEKAILLIPSELAYGPSGAGNVIAPNTALRFDVELTNIQ
jgi:FKBP-type peptidyl-prolyl cis-trans isomerase